MPVVPCYMAIHLKHIPLKHISLTNDHKGLYWNFSQCKCILYPHILLYYFIFIELTSIWQFCIHLYIVSLPSLHQRLLVFCSLLHLQSLDLCLRNTMRITNICWEVEWINTKGSVCFWGAVSHCSCILGGTWPLSFPLHLQRAWPCSGQFSFTQAQVRSVSAILLLDGPHLEEAMITVSTWSSFEIT